MKCNKLECQKKGFQIKVPDVLIKDNFFIFRYCEEHATKSFGAENEGWSRV